jgi:hypothetical protein
VPAIVTDEPTAPELGVRAVMLGGGVTVKLMVLLVPNDVTTSTAAVPKGVFGSTVKQTCWVNHEMMFAATPFTRTLSPVPRRVWKLDPLTHCGPPTATLSYSSESISGVPTTLMTPLLLEARSTTTNTL